jgi:hypothetical protein
MNAGSIIALLRSDQFARETFLGIAWNDSEFKINKFPASIIFNTDTYKGPGIHWCATYFIDEKNCEYFDPFGLPPFVQGTYDFSKVLANNSQTVRFSGFPVQDLDASTCGHHCVYFILLRSRNIPLKKILKDHYSKNIQFNDEKVKNFVDNQSKYFNLT